MHQNKPVEMDQVRAFDGKGRNAQTNILRNVLGAFWVRDNDHEDTGIAGYWDQEFQIGDSTFFAEAEVRRREADQPHRGVYGKHHIGKLISVIEGKEFRWYFPFAFGTVSVPQRKAKNLSGLFSSIDEKEHFAFLYTKQAMLESKIIWKRCQNYGKNEPYYDVPVNKGLFVYRDREGQWHWYSRSSLKVDELIEQIF